MSVKEKFKSMAYGPALESRDAADAWLDSYDRKFQLFINGEWQKASSRRYFESSEPANGKHLAKYAEANAADVDRAVKAAAAAAPGWQKLSGHERAKYLYAIARQLQKHSRVFAVLESIDNGKPIRETRDLDIPLAARHFYHHAGWAQLFEKEFEGAEPLGVVGQIIPWNFPLLMLAWKIAPALASGNTVVLKPAEYTSLTAIRFAELCQNIGLPAGVVNIVTGAGQTGAALAAHPDVKKVAFTGSTEVGRILRRQTAGTGKKLSLELGGKSPFIVFEDADLDSAVEGVVDAIWFNQGEVCCAGSRLLVQESVQKVFLRKLKRRMSKLRVGNPLDKGIDMGAIVDPIQLASVKKKVKAGLKEGGEIWQPDLDLPRKGCWYPPTLITGVGQASKLAQEEVFGPVLVSMPFRSPAEAIKLANNSRYGLAASIWTENVNLALDVAPALKVGTVWINSTNHFDAASGFGGYRESGFGREGGKEGMWEYVKQTRAVKGEEAPLAQASGKVLKSAGIDRTAKLYIGGKQSRPDGGAVMPVLDSRGREIGEVGSGNRKDIRNAVEAAHAASGWAGKTAHLRAQILYYLAENLQSRKDEFESRLRQLGGLNGRAAETEFEMSISRLFEYAAWADKYEGRVHRVPMRNVTLAMPEAIGVMGIVCPRDPGLLGLVSTVAPAIAMGNTTVVIPSERYSLLATDFYQVLDTSDVPAGVCNIVTGDRESLTSTLAAHDDVDAIWYWGSAEGSRKVEEVSAENMKRTWVNYGQQRDWKNTATGSGEEFLRRATEVKNIWVPYGV